MKTFRLLLLTLTLAFTASAFGQGLVYGVIKDGQTNESLVGATVLVKGTTTGSITDVSGNFNFEVEAGSATLVVQFVGYEAKDIDVTVPEGGRVNIGTIKLTPTTFGLTGIQVISERAQERETPVAISNLDKKEIEEILGSRDIPMAMNITPNVYATQGGGGAGDARVNVRGFNQRNVAIMINGVPVNDMENGWVYWSNWDGVGDATSSIQMQRGLSAVNLATPSIGGTMNVITNPAEQKAGVTYKQEFGSGQFLKSTLFGHTGLIKGKYAFSAGGVRKTGQGVIDKTWTDAWAYYFGASWNINSKNRLELYAIGAPQRHGQNLYMQNIAAYSHDYAKEVEGYDEAALEAFQEDQSGRFYNENWGKVNFRYTGKQYWNGKERDRYNPHYINERENYYHKPLVNLNWFTQWSEKVTQYTVAYYSGGKGGGTGTYGSIKWDYSGPSRMADWDATIANNQEPENGDTAQGILRNSVNNQWTLGLISKVKWNISEKFKMSFGIDGRTAEIEHYREVRDLLGGKFFYWDRDEFSTGTQHNKMLGDKFDYNFTNTVNWLGGYAQAEYNYGPVTAYAMAGYSGIKYGYTNHFRASDEDPNAELTAESDWIAGYQAKGGANYRWNEVFNTYVNLGYVSKVPIFDNVISDRDGTKAESPENEKFTSFELGVQYFNRAQTFRVNGNLYFTTWMDRSRNIGITNQDGSEGFIFVQGMDQRHMGAELEGAWKPVNYFELLFAASINNWTYLDNVSGVYKDYAGGSETEEEYNYYVKDLKVGDAPQTQLVLGAGVFPLKGVRLQLLMKHYRDHYADWDPFSRTDPDETEQVWKVPAATVFDLHASWDLPLESKVNLQVFAHVFNLFDTFYIQDALDNSRFNAYRIDGEIVNPHSADAAEVYLGIPRIVNFGFMLNF